MSINDFHALSVEYKKIILESRLGNRGTCVSVKSGMCGEIFVFDRGINTIPRFSCVKVPKLLNGITYEEVSNRFVRELELQLSFYHSTFVNWAFDFDTILNVPSASFRYWDGDLESFIREGQHSNIKKFSLILYLTAGLEHCYKRGLVAHQDLKPANILIKNNHKNFKDLPDLDIYHFAMLADFGLSNAFIDYRVFEGSRPYMAPEQWKKEELSQATDVFALGVILYELMTNGYHPTGILLSDFWPEPKDGNTKKWTRKEPWEKWINNGAQITSCPAQIDPEIIVFIKRMLSIPTSDRPKIEEVKLFLLGQINREDQKSFEQIEFLINYFEKETSDLSISESWPYLSKKWDILKSKFIKSTI